MDSGKVYKVFAKHLDAKKCSFEAKVCCSFCTVLYYTKVVLEIFCKNVFLFGEEQKRNVNRVIRSDQEGHEFFHL